MAKKISLYVMSFFYVMAGFNHFMNPEYYLKMIPPYMPSPLTINVIAGAAEMLLGMMLVRPAVRSLAAWGIILLLAAIFPANLHMAQLGGGAFGVPTWALWVRLPLQLVLMAWAFIHTKNPDCDMREIETAIDIQSPGSTIWRELTAWDRYGEWNPFIVSAVVTDGKLRAGAKTRVTIQQPDGSRFQFQNTILDFSAPRSLAWRGSFIVRGLFDGTHYFRIEESAHGGSRFIHGEKFEGILVGVFAGLLAATQQGFEMMNVALKARCEK